MKYLEDVSVYALLGPNGTARIHASDIDQLPRVEHLSVDEYYQRHYMDVIRCFKKGCLIDAVKNIITDFCFEMDMFIYSKQERLDDFSMLLDKVHSLNKKWSILSYMFSKSSGISSNAFNLNEYLYMLNETLFRIINVRTRDTFHNKQAKKGL